MAYRRLFLVTFALTSFVSAQTPTLTVDAAANRHPISPDIYGINDYADTGLAQTMRVGVRRFGGDGTNRYNWMIDTRNSASDYYFENYFGTNTDPSHLPNGSSFDKFVEAGIRTGTKRIGTTSLLGWLPKSEANTCSYSVAKYGPQKSVDPYHMDCGNGLLPDGTQITNNDPTDTSQQFDQTYQQAWIRYLVEQYDSGSRGGVQIWSLDNEPEWWSSVHMDVHKAAASYDEVLSKGILYAQAIKQADPTALVTGPIPGGWTGFFWSRTDFNAGWNTFPYKAYDNPVDQMAHGGVPFVEWYMQQMRAYEQQHGQRLLDYVDVHAYISPNNIAFGTAVDPATTQLRLTSTRVFWDPNWASPDDSTASPKYPSPLSEPPYLVPRMKQWVANDYPGTKTAITEYNWGALNDITGAVAQADIFGIFGREGLDLATLWGPPTTNPLQPGVFAFQIYLNYDGLGGQFGETSVSANTTNPDQISIFAAQRSDHALTVMVLNKMPIDATTPVSIANFSAASTAQVWQYNSANLTAIQHLADVPVAGGNVSLNFPAYSMTLLVIPAAPNSLPVPKPVIGGVAGAASYDTHAVSPGELVYIAGTNLGPASLAGAALTPDGNYLSQSIAGVRVLVNGFPAPMIYATAGAVSAVIPYEAALYPTAAIQVEVQGVRSDAFTMPLTTAVPALFTTDASGKGQGAILNQDLSRNSSANPATRGQIVVLYGTGEGQTTPPGVDGRLASGVLPAPMGPCTVMIGGQSAPVQYCGAAPNFTSGLLQINATVPTNVAAGNQTVTVTIGGSASSGLVTVALK